MKVNITVAALWCLYECALAQLTHCLVRNKIQIKQGAGRDGKHAKSSICLQNSLCACCRLGIALSAAGWMA